MTTPTAVALVPAGPAPRLPARQAGGFSLLIRKKGGAVSLRWRETMGCGAWRVAQLALPPAPVRADRVASVASKGQRDHARTVLE